jgi:uncharacterized protein YcfJ
MKTKLMAAVFALVGSSALADTIVVQGEVVSTNPVRSYITESVPQQVCQNVQVTQQYRQDNQVAGAVIGAIIGNQFGSGSGKDAMTVLGAIVGADQGRKNSHVRTETTNHVECYVEWVTVQTHHRHGFETVIYDGSQYFTFHTNERFRYGDYVSFHVQIQ